MTTSYTGQVPAGILPAFQPNSSPSNNNLNIPNNSAPVVLSLASYGNVIIGINADVTFSGQSTVRIKELTIKEGAKIHFAQNTDLLVNKGIAMAKNTLFNPESLSLKCYAAEKVTIGLGAQVMSSIYTLKDLIVEKATSVAPTKMTGLFIAANVNAQDFVQWNWSTGCPFAASANLTASTEERSNEADTVLGQLQISPNPASEEAQLLFTMEAQTPVTVQLLDATGRLLQSKQFDAQQGINQLRLDLSALPEGLYNVQLSAQGLRTMEKLIVLRP